MRVDLCARTGEKSVCSTPAVNWRGLSCCELASKSCVQDWCETCVKDWGANLCAEPLV